MFSVSPRDKLQHFETLERPYQQEDPHQMQSVNFGPTRLQNQNLKGHLFFINYSVCVLWQQKMKKDKPQIGFKLEERHFYF